MKVRKDFVTNSSSSSFIISKDNISHDDLLKVLLEIANKESHYYDDDEENYTEEDITENCVAYRYHIKEATKENPHPEYDDYWGSLEKVYDNHYIIDNDDCGRYDWDAIEEVLKKHNIPWEYGYCD